MFISSSRALAENGTSLLARCAGDAMVNEGEQLLLYRYLRSFGVTIDCFDISELPQDKSQ